MGPGWFGRVPLSFPMGTYAVACLIQERSAVDRAGVYMSELLYNLGQLDQRMRPLVFAVRHWAQLREVTCSQPGGPHLSNFMLTLMMIHYLQTRQPCVLPTVSLMRSMAGELRKATPVAAAAESWASVLYSGFHFGCWLRKNCLQLGHQFTLL